MNNLESLVKEQLGFIPPTDLNHEIKLDAGELEFKFKMMNNQNRTIKYKDSKKDFSHNKGITIAPIIPRDTDKSLDEVFIVEGESDYLSLLRFTRNILCFAGANQGQIINNYHSEIARIFGESPTFYLCFDNDAAGFKASDEVKSLLLDQFKDCRVVILDWNQLSEINDLRELFNTGYSIEKLRDVLKKSKSYSALDELLALVECHEDKLLTPIDFIKDKSQLVYSSKVRDKAFSIYNERDSLKISMKLLLKLKEGRSIGELKGVDLKELFNLVESDLVYQDVWDDLLSILKSCLYFEREESYTLVSIYIIMTYMYPVFDSCPYLYINGPKGSGKSTLAECVSKLSFNGLHLNHGSTMNASLREIDANRGVVSLDDAEHLTSGDKDIISILNSGYKTNGTHLKCDGNDNKAKTFYVGGPKIINNINGIDEVTRDRCISILSSYAPTSYKQIRIADKVFRSMRSKLICLSLKIVKDVTTYYEDNVTSRAGRLHELEMPLKSIGITLERLLDEATVLSDLVGSLKVSELNKNKHISFDDYVLRSLFIAAKFKGYNGKSVKVFNSEICIVFKDIADETFEMSKHHVASHIKSILDANNLIISSRRINSKIGKETCYEINSLALRNLALKNSYMDS